MLAGCGASPHVAAPHAPTTPAPVIPTTGTTKASRPSLPPGRLALLRSLAAPLRAAGPNSGAVVYDITAGKQLFAYKANVKRPPASVEKLYTSVAVLTDIGPSAKIHTTLLGAGHPGPGGVWHGSLYLRGGHCL